MYLAGGPPFFEATTFVPKFVQLYFQSEFVRELGLGGGMVWALDLDDFRNRCGEGPHPLMNAIKSVLGPARGQYAGTKDQDQGSGSAPTESAVVVEEIM